MEARNRPLNLKEKPRGPSNVGVGACNGVHPERLNGNERLSEFAGILAAGLVRLRARQSSALSADFGESSLDCADDQSGHANVLTDGGKE